MDRFHKEISDAIRQENPAKLLIMAVNRAHYLKNPEIANLLMELAEIISVEFSTEIGSASIGFEAGIFHLRFNREFINEYVSTPDCLLFLVLHELLHKLRGDLFKTFDGLPENKVLANIAFDLLIDRDLCSLFMFPVPLLGKLYSEKEILLRILFFHISQLDRCP